MLFCFVPMGSYTRTYIKFTNITFGLLYLPFELIGSQSADSGAVQQRQNSVAANRNVGATGMRQSVRLMSTAEK